MSAAIFRSLSEAGRTPARVFVAWDRFVAWNRCQSALPGRCRGPRCVASAFASAFMHCGAADAPRTRCVSRDHSKDGAHSLANVARRDGGLGRLRENTGRPASYNIAMTRKTRIQPIESAPAAEVDANENGYDRPSKSQLKRDMHALQELGEALIALPKDALKRMPMPEKPRRRGTRSAPHHRSRRQAPPGAVRGPRDAHAERRGNRRAAHRARQLSRRQQAPRRRSCTGSSARAKSCSPTTPR